MVIRLIFFREHFMYKNKFSWKFLNLILYHLFFVFKAMIYVFHNVGSHLNKWWNAERTYIYSRIFLSYRISSNLSFLFVYKMFYFILKEHIIFYIDVFWDKSRKRSNGEKLGCLPLFIFPCKISENSLIDFDIYIFYPLNPVLNLKGNI